MEPTSVLYQHYWSAALDYWRDPQRRSWILVCPVSIGEVWIICALAQAFRDTHGAPITIVIRESHKHIPQLFPKVVDRIIIWEDDRLIKFSQRLIGQGAFAVDEPIIVHPHFQGLGRYWASLTQLLRYPGRGGLTVIDHLRLILQLDWESPLTQTVVPIDWHDDAVIYAKEIGLERDKSVILFPDNNTMPSLPNKFWEDLTVALVRSGKKVFTNMTGTNAGPRTVPFKGSDPINITIKNGIPLVEMAGRFISMANGFQFLLLGSRVRAEHTTILYDFPSSSRLRGSSAKITDSISIQTMKFYGLPWINSSINEFVIRSENISTDFIRDIAVNNSDVSLKL